ncbi:Fibulin-1 [Trichostrongylus colubriformis]|uniref:Fibulin-1 n=1 Tax=Trichostrongylus colubriformis TaxID=6319 RepID=A0AAN8F7N4_TRICO
MLKTSAFTSTLLLLGVISTVIKANELSRCCSGGSRHFQQTHTCSNIKSEGTRVTCIRAASICCLRALLDSACEEGTELAKQDETCPSSINSLGGGLRKECCECCLLAGELLAKNQPCTPPTGFSAACLRSFSRCCQGSFEFTQTFPISTVSETNAVYLGDRCAHSKCDHLCNDRGGENVECTCRPGYDLGPDGQSCVDIDECLLLMDDCLESQRCLNLPGSFKCIRTLSCGTGYAMDSETEECIDVDECNLGAHDCGPLYQCRNTQGSYSDQQSMLSKKRVKSSTKIDELLRSGANGRKPAVDIDKAVSSTTHRLVKEVISFMKQTAVQDTTEQYRISGFSVLEPEKEPLAISRLTNLVSSNKLPRSVMRANVITLLDKNMPIVNRKALGVAAMGMLAICVQMWSINTVRGQEVTRLRVGLKSASEKMMFMSVAVVALLFSAVLCTVYAKDLERALATGLLNKYPSSFSAADGRTCVDIDECKLWSGAGNDLCMGECINTKGSYLCTCPPGYKIQPDNRTCVDIDECALGECQGHERICVNTLGQFKCHQIQCPENYVHDSNYKNRCNRQRSVCGGLTENACKARYPVHITWQYIAIPKGIAITSHRPTITLFTIKGPAHNDSIVQFELNLKRAIPEAPSVLLAIRQNFLLQKGKDRNSAVIAVRDTLDGPQTIELELILRLTKKSQFTGKYIANLIVHVAPHKRHSGGFGHK